MKRKLIRLLFMSVIILSLGLFLNAQIEDNIDSEYLVNEIQNVDRIGVKLSHDIVEHIVKTERFVDKEDAEYYATKKCLMIIIFMLSIQFLVVYEIKSSNKKISREISDSADSTNKIMFNLFKRIGGDKNER